METQMNGLYWTILTRLQKKNHSNKEQKNNFIKNKKERANTERTRESDSTKPQSQIRMFSRRKKTFLSFTLSLFYLFVAPVMQVLPVYGEAAEVISVWEVMATELIGANSIITDQAVVNAYSSALGSIDAAHATAEVIQIGLSNAANACGVDLAPIFENTAESAAAVGVTATAATAAQNLAASCASVASSVGSVVLPALGGAVVVGTGVAIGVGINHICKKVYDLFGKCISTGISIQNRAYAQSLGYGTSTAVYGNGNTRYAITGNPAIICIPSQGGSPENYYGSLVIMNTSSERMTFQKIIQNGATSNIGVNGFDYNQIAYDAVRYMEGLKVNGNPRNILTGIRNGTIEIPLNQSPDISSVNGLLKWNPEDNPELLIPNIPELRPLPDYANGYGLSPVPEADYQDIVTYINSQPKPSSLEDQQQQEQNFPTVINPIIDPYIVPIGDPSPGPGTDPQPTGSPDPQPTGSPNPNPNPNPNPKPNTNPFPDPETVPQPTPVVNPTPDSDVVPAPVPYPDPETPTEQDKTDTDTKITPIDLRDKFPFCIPFDIVKIMKLFQGGREAPCFTWEIPFGAAGSGSVTVDLSAWDTAAALLRTLELILFIMLLAVGTRNLIGGSS